MTISTVAVTGGNGKIGTAILEHLAESGYDTANISRGSRREEVSDTYVRTDLLDAGETYGALAKTGADAVVHMGTIPDPYSNPTYRVYESNVMSAMHVLEASDALGLEAVCLPSSINAIGSEHQERPADVQYLPVDEEHPRTPDDSYGIAKHAMEVTADGFGRRPSTDLTIASLRYPWVMTEPEMREHFVESDRSIDGVATAHPATTRDVLFSYLHVEDAAAIARKSIEADFSGHEVFWAVAGDTTMGVPTKDVIAEYFPNAEIRTAFDGYETIVDLARSRELLGWTPERSWRDL
ncbi:NAD-dependent epimerase/dehydratase family protein [Natrarchaeobius sp. A-rgal3]|uniref:NAD-dependent epimerase/dehydratase family protein n=1 Tax=Natrarchaeobius versutus TaxID=1679078 RepID=UPI003510B586